MGDCFSRLPLRPAFAGYTLHAPPEAYNRRPPELWKRPWQEEQSTGRATALRGKTAAKT
ncbi:MAG TPA: hypothetical protein VGB55_01865 [Tepidisphaeraceae bacterium]